ncbi:hypothetical protein PR202_ga19168 [Eleusine coracana subsp. coracana]|uniref:Uncharacterized protein n=1 Tax=Eleusine coracana subsp. coracana TaxID=191504 RepID=A0AAV5CUX2_ELECO|nr:hypothetical protein PR202_ga19168 [Eleusine coracana subsp. coracana]
MGKGRAPCCAKVGLNKGSWTPEEDMRLVAYIRKYGHANWRALPKQAGTWSKIAACLPGRTDNEIKNVWNTHLKKRVPPPPCGAHQDHGAKTKKKKKLKTSGAEATVPSPSPASSTTTATTNCSTGESSGAEQHSDDSNRDGELGDLISNLDIPVLDDDAGFDFDMLAVDVGPVLPELYSSSCPSASPCASSTSPPPPLDLPPEIDIDQELWSIIDGDGSFAGTTPPCHGNATGEAAATTTTTISQEEDEDGKEWWLENLERELGLWGPMDDYQNPTGPLGLAHHPDPLPAMMMVHDPVTSYFQPGPNVAYK